MSHLRPGKKLQPAKDAWKSFPSTLQSKVHKLNIPMDIKGTFKRLLTALHSLHHLIPSRGRRRRSFTARTPCPPSNYHVHRHSKKNISAIRIDDLFAEPAASSMHVHANKAHAQEETRRGKEVVGNKDLPGGNSGIDTIEDAWKIVVAKTPQLQVDERAEEFISKFYQDMRLQKERSLLEFQEMLARSA